MLSLVAPWLINLAQLGAIALIHISRISWFMEFVLVLANKRASQQRTFTVLIRFYLDQQKGPGLGLTGPKNQIKKG